MKFWLKKSLIYLLLAILACAILPACTPVENTDAAGLENNIKEPDSSTLASEGAAPSLGSQDDLVNQDPAAPKGMVVFEGNIVVASTELNPNLWQEAGWQIGDQPLDTETQVIPPDCTLYPHFGIENQWIGSCTGHIYIPQAGAKHIAVILTHPDGSTTMVQVAPPPNTP